MSEKHNKIFSSSDCISQELLKKYISQRANSDEKRKVEEHIIDCEMCNDELEGLSLLNNRNLSPIINNLNEEIDSVAKSKNKRFFLDNRLHAVAASVLVLIFISFLYFNNAPNIKVLDNSKKSETIILAKNNIETSNTIIDSIISNEKITVEVIEEKDFDKSAEEKLDKKLEIKEEENKKTEEVNISDEIEVNNDLEVIEEIEEEKILEEQSPPKIESLSLAEAEIALDMAYDSGYENKTPKDLVSQSEETTSVVASREIGDDGVSEISVAKVTSSKKEVDFIKDRVSNANEVIKNDYELGLEEYNNKNYITAIEYFKKYKSGNSYHNAQWFLAHSYINIGKISKAKKILQNLSEEDSFYKDKAKDLLNKL